MKIICWNIQTLGNNKAEIKAVDIAHSVRAIVGNEPFILVILEGKSEHSGGLLNPAFSKVFGSENLWGESHELGGDSYTQEHAIVYTSGVFGMEIKCGFAEAEKVMVPLYKSAAEQQLNHIRSRLGGPSTSEVRRWGARLIDPAQNESLIKELLDQEIEAGRLRELNWFRKALVVSIAGGAPSEFITLGIVHLPGPSSQIGMNIDLGMLAQAWVQYLARGGCNLLMGDYNYTGSLHPGMGWIELMTNRYKQTSQLDNADPITARNVSYPIVGTTITGNFLHAWDRIFTLNSLQGHLAAHKYIPTSSLVSDHMAMCVSL